MTKIGREVLFLKTHKGNPRNGEGAFISFRAQGANAVELGIGENDITPDFVIHNVEAVFFGKRKACLAYTALCAAKVNNYGLFRDARGVFAKVFYRGFGVEANKKQIYF